ncbi:hypothetical protein BaRGS_00030580, partial [Batillaria attramentaria]
VWRLKMGTRNPVAVHRQEEGREEQPFDIRPVFRPKLIVACQAYNGHIIAENFWGELHVNSDDRPQDLLKEIQNSIRCIGKLGNVTFCKILEHGDILQYVTTLLESSDYVKPETFFKVKILELSAERWCWDLLETYPDAVIDSTMGGATRALRVKSLFDIRQLWEQVYNSRHRRDTLYLVQIGIYQDPGEQFASQFSLAEMPCWKPAFAFAIMDTNSSYARYAPAGRRVLQNPGDAGNCLFNALSRLYCGDNGFTHQFRLGACLFGARNFKRIYEHQIKRDAGNVSEERVKFKLAGLRRASEGCNSAEPLPLRCLLFDEIFQTSIDRNPAGYLQLILAASYLARLIRVFKFVNGCEGYEETLVIPIHTPLGVLEPLELSLVDTGASPVGHYVPLVCAKL